MVLSRLKVRLDDGTLIAHNSVLGLPCEDYGKLLPSKATARTFSLFSDVDVKRIEGLLAVLSQALPQHHNAQQHHQQQHHQQLQHNNYHAQEANASKRARTSALQQAGGVDWTEMARSVLMGTIKHLGKEAHWFKDPVDPVLVPDYHMIITHPIWTRKIEKKLNDRAYASPQDFHADFKLLWNNCATYNKADVAVSGTVRAVGARGEKKFDELWYNSGLASEARTKRMTAGVAPVKYEEEAYDNGLKPKSSGGKGGGGPKGSEKKGGKAGGGGNEVTSGSRGGAPGPLTAEERAAIGEQLRADMESGALSEELTGELVNMLPESALKMDDEGDTELDFESLGDDMLRQINEWRVRCRAGAATAAAPASPPPSPTHSVQVEAGTEEEEEEEEYDGSDTD